MALACDIRIPLCRKAKFFYPVMKAGFSAASPVILGVCAALHWPCTDKADPDGRPEITAPEGRAGLSVWWIRLGASTRLMRKALMLLCGITVAAAPLEVAQADSRRCAAKTHRQHSGHERQHHRRPQYQKQTSGIRAIRMGCVLVMFALYWALFRHSSQACAMRIGLLMLFAHRLRHCILLRRFGARQGRRRPARQGCWTLNSPHRSIHPSFQPKSRTMRCKAMIWAMGLAAQPGCVVRKFAFWSALPCWPC